MLPIVMFFQQAGAPAAGVDPAVGGDPTGGLGSTLIMLVPMVAIFYFLILRPQNQRMKKIKEMLGALKKGDQVITTGGVIGKITKLADDEITIDTGEGNKLLLTRNAVAGLYTRAEPKPANDVKES